MEHLDQIWTRRAKEFWNMAIRYLRLIGNSGFLFTIYLAIIAGSYYYSELLMWLPTTFPAALFLSLITAWLLTNSRIRTFLKSGDLVFLAPVEGRLQSYFRSSFYYSFLMQSFLIVLTVVILTPLYRHFISDEPKSLYFVTIVLVIAKGWNLLSQWEEARLLYASSRVTHKLLRFFVNLALTYFLFAQASIYFIIGIMLVQIFLLLFYYQHMKKEYSLKWEYLIAAEEESVMAFYRMANTFTDVPRLSTKVKPRSFFSKVADYLPFQERFVYHFLYVKSFVRANDYFGIYTRLLLIGFVFLFYVKIEFASIFISSLLLYMSALQLSTLWKHHQFKLWIDLYPLTVENREQAFSTVVFWLLIIKSALFAMITFIATAAVIETILVLVVTLMISYVYSFFLLHRRREETI